VSQLDPRRNDKNQPSITDPWIRARLNYLSAECNRLTAGPIARRFLEEAKSRYQQYRRCGCPRLRFLAWSALDIVAGQLVGGAACSGEALRAQEELNDNKH
jgi:hypothetical protein